MKLAAVQATDERPIAPPHLRQISVHTAVSSLGQKDDRYTHTRLRPFSGTTRVSRYQKGKTNVDFTEARDSEWQWHQLGHMQVCSSL